MSDPTHVTTYRRPLAGGAVRDQRTGIDAALKAGDSADAASATWLFKADELGGLKPRPGDRFSDAFGGEWTVTAVGKLADGAYPCVCSRDENEE